MFNGAGCYVCGGMTGYPLFNRPAFFAVEGLLWSAGAVLVVNPGREPDGLTWVQYMRRGLRNLRRCDVMVRLPGWERSRGARIETAFAERWGVRIHDLPAWPCSAVSCRLLEVV